VKEAKKRQGTRTDLNPNIKANLPQCQARDEASITE